MDDLFGSGAAFEEEAGAEGNMKNIQIFSYDDDEIRSKSIDGRPWLMLADLCRLLDIGNPSQAAVSLDGDDLITTEVIDRMGRKQSARMVNESGTYQLIFQSRKPEARAIRRWVTNEVLPALRKTGTYSVPDIADAPEIAMARGLVAAQQMLEQSREQIAELSAKVDADAPKVAYIDEFVADQDCKKVRFVAASLNVGEQWLRELLLEKRWIYVETESRWSNSEGKKKIRNQYSEAADKKKYFRAIPVHEVPRFKGEVYHTLKVTPAGMEAIARLVKRTGEAA